MLSKQEKEKIESELKHYPDRRAAIAEALMLVQESRGWVSDQAVADVAEALDLSREEVDGIATFFELVFRKAVGKHVILVCDSVSCWITGYECILAHLCRSLGIGLGETTPDGLFTLLPVACLGACEMSPAMMIDGKLFGNLSPEVLDRILADYREGEHGNAAHG
jgi:NADH-quinone oxidoreductase subunit E